MPLSTASSPGRPVVAGGWFRMLIYWPRNTHRLASDQSLVEHRIGHFDEAGDVGAYHVVPGHTVILDRCAAVTVDIDHDAMQTLIHFLAIPAQAHRVLCHLQAGGGHTASVGGFAGANMRIPVLAMPPKDRRERLEHFTRGLRSEEHTAELHSRQ